MPTPLQPQLATHASARATGRELDDTELLVRTHRGDRDAAVLLWHRFGPRLIALAAAVLRERDMVAAQDVVQGVFVRLLSLDKRVVREVQDVAAWMSRLTRNAALNYIRECARRRARVHRATQGQVVFQAPASGDLPPDLHDAIDTLPDGQREAVLLKHIAGLTFDQMADALQENRNTVASRYRAAMVSLRKLLGEPEEDGTRTPPTHFHLVGASGGGGGGGNGGGPTRG